MNGKDKKLMQTIMVPMMAGFMFEPGKWLAALIGCLLSFIAYLNNDNNPYKGCFV